MKLTSRLSKNIHFSRDFKKFKPGFHMIFRIIRIASVVSKKNFKRPGRSYGNATQTIANDRDDWDDLDRLDRIEFYPDDRDDRVNFESPGSFPILWVAFPYDRPDRLNIFWDDWDDPDNSDDYMETRL